MDKLIDAEIIRETEKACQLDVTLDTATGMRGWKLWLPKSQLDVRDDGVYARQWIVVKKLDELRRDYPRLHVYCILSEAA